MSTEPNNAAKSDSAAQDGKSAWRKQFDQDMAFVAQTAEELKRWAAEARKAQGR